MMRFYESVFLVSSIMRWNEKNRCFLNYEGMVVYFQCVLMRLYCGFRSQKERSKKCSFYTMTVPLIHIGSRPAYYRDSIINENFQLIISLGIAKIHFTKVHTIMVI